MRGELSCLTKTKKVSNKKKTKSQPISAKKSKKPETEKKVENVKNTAAISRRKKHSYKQDNYEFQYFYKSEPQLNDIDGTYPPEIILSAFDRVITVQAKKYEREGVELEDLISEAKAGLMEVIEKSKRELASPEREGRKKKTYNFYQACLYKIRERLFQYCLGNATQIKTPYYIQRGCMHVGQIFKLFSNQSVAEKLLGRKGPATEQDIIDFLYDEEERLPNKPMAFIKAQIKKDPSKKEYKQILSGILQHERGSHHSYVKNHLTDVGKALQIKQKLYFASSSNNMNYNRVMTLILSVMQTKVELTATTYSPQYDDMDANVLRGEIMDLGKEVCGEREFTVFYLHKVLDKSYEDISKETGLKKPQIVEIIKECIKKLRKDENFIEFFNSMV